MWYRWTLILCAVMGLLMAVTFINKGASHPRVNINTEATVSSMPNPMRNPYSIGIAASGIIEAYGDNIEIGVPYGAIIKKCFVIVGQKVCKNDPLYLLDDGPLLAQVQVQEENLKRAKEIEKKVKSQLDRLQSLSDERAVSIEDLKNKIADHEVALFDIKVAEMTLEKAKADLEQLTIRAPCDGIVLKYDLRPGNFAPIEPKNPNTIVGRTDLLQVRVDIDEENAYRIKPNQKAIAYTKDVTRKEFALEFMRIEPYVIAKKELTGEPRELIDTRVLQVIYKLVPIKEFILYPGQQLDIFIEDKPLTIDSNHGKKGI